MCLRFSQISNPVWSDRQVNKWSIELKLMFNCLLLLPSEESESKTQIPIKDIIYSLTLELGVVSEWIYSKRSELDTLQENFITTRLWGRESPIQGVVKDPSCVPDNTKDIHTKLVTWADAGKADIIREGGHHPDHGRHGACHQGCDVRGHAGSAVFDIVRIAGSQSR